MAKQQASCEFCARYVFDEDTQSYVCDVDMDEDEYVRFLHQGECHYFILNDEYKIVRKQM